MPGSTVVFGIEMGWRHLLFANWPVDPDVVGPHLPSALSVDTYDGEAWLSVVPFTNVAVRPQGLPAAAGFALPELNLRTYVTCDGEPGVYFFSLDAHGLLGVLTARALHHLPYYYARMAMESVGDLIRFDSRRLHPGARPLRFEATWESSGAAFQPDPGSLAHFLVERYRYYTEDTEGRIRYSDIDHEPWTLYPAEATFEDNDCFSANWFDEPPGSPVCYCTPGLDVTATASKRWG